VLVSVGDQGIGMSPRDMGRLFEQFYFILPTSDDLAGGGR
jgi:signal transduction histidine kinase